MTRITIAAGGIELEAVLLDTPTAAKIAAVLPLQAVAHVWGEEIYFDVPVQAEPEPDAHEEVDVGALGYWPLGPAFCIFFGPTPCSTDEKPRAYSPVNVFGRVLGDATLLKSVAGGAPVRVALAEANG